MSNSNVFNPLHFSFFAQEWVSEPDKIPVLSRALSQLHRIGAGNNESAPPVLRCALAFAIWEHFLRPILSELFPFGENPSTKKSALNPLVVIPMLNSCQQVVQAMSAYAKQVSSKPLATVSEWERLCQTEFSHDLLCTECLRFLPGCAGTNTRRDTKNTTSRLAHSALKALKVRIVVCFINACLS